MKVALVGAELEENLGLRYMASSLERDGHEAVIVPFNTINDVDQSVAEIERFSPGIVGLSMVFTSRAREFCHLANTLRVRGYAGHIIGGGHFAALNCQRLLADFPAFSSVGLGEGEQIICDLARDVDHPAGVAGLCYRSNDNGIRVNPSAGNPADLDAANSTAILASPLPASSAAAAAGATAPFAASTPGIRAAAARSFATAAWTTWWLK